MVDVFPRRNLPGASDVWGREVETRTASNELSIESLQQSLSGQNRNTASSLSVISKQIQELIDTQATIPITSSAYDFAADFAVPELIPAWGEFVRVDIPNPEGRNQLNISCVGSIRVFETIGETPTTVRSIIRLYRADTGVEMAAGGVAIASRTPFVAEALRSATPIFAGSFTTPPEGVYVTLSLASSQPANYPFHTDNLAEMIVQTSFL